MLLQLHKHTCRQVTVIDAYRHNAKDMFILRFGPAVTSNTTEDAKCRKSLTVCSGLVVVVCVCVCGGGGGGSNKKKNVETENANWLERYLNNKALINAFSVVEESVTGCVYNTGIIRLPYLPIDSINNDIKGYTQHTRVIWVVLRENVSSSGHLLQPRQYPLCPLVLPAACYLLGQSIIPSNTW